MGVAEQHLKHFIGFDSDILIALQKQSKRNRLSNGFHVVIALVILWPFADRSVTASLLHVSATVAKFHHRLSERDSLLKILSRHVAPYTAR